MFYILVCPPVCGDNPLQRKGGLFPVYVDNFGVTGLYPYISVVIAQYEKISC